MEIVKTIKRIEMLDKAISRVDFLKASDATVNEFFKVEDRRADLIKSVTVDVRTRKQLRLALKLLVKRGELDKRTADFIY